MNTAVWPCLIKTARQKRRLVKTDRDKRLIQLHKRQSELWLQKRSLPMVPLVHPYQRGWKRVFVLRDDVKHSPRAKFYETLLAKINTVQYQREKVFKRKKRCRKRYGYEERRQYLLEFDTYSWYANNADLTGQEKACFTKVEIFDITTRRINIKYIFTEPWRFVLKVMPHIVTHIQLIDSDIESELSCIRNHIDRHNLSPRINKLTRGRRYNYRDWYHEAPKYINNIKNIPRYAGKEAYLELTF